MDKVNRSRRMLAFAVLCLGLGIAPAGLRAQDTADRHMLWEVSSDAGLEGYLVGSVHVMKPGIYPLDAVYQNAFARSDVLVFEISLDSMMAKGRQMMTAGMLEGGKTLETVLSAETYELTRKTAAELGVAMTMFNKMEPWLVSITLPAIQYQRAGYAGTSGLDLHFFTRAEEAGKKRLALETVEFQIQLFDGLPPELQESLLRHSLAQADRTVKMIDKMMGYWKTGDTAGLAELMMDQWRSSFPDFFHRIVVERNHNWMPRIQELLRAEPVPMIVVGAGHVIGKEGLVRLLEERGYTVAQR